MALFNKKDLSDYRERVELKLSVLSISPVLSGVQKETITTLYLQLIAILDEAIVTEIEVIEYQEI